MRLKTPFFLLAGNRKRIVMAAGTCLIALAAAAALRFVPFDNDIEVMLPRQPEILRTFHFFRDSPFSENILVSFKLKEEGLPLTELTAAVDRFAGSIDSPMITRVFTGAEAQRPFEEVREFVRLAPQLMDEAELGAVDAKMTPEFVAERLGQVYRGLLAPAGLFTAPVMQQDPLGLQEKSLKNLRSLFSQRDYDIRAEGGHLISEDGRHALVILETPVPVTDGFGARKLVSYIEGLLARLPAHVSADLIAGHLHSLSNERIIKRDILVTAAAAAAAFIVLFLFLFRDMRALLLFLIPMISVMAAIPVCALVLGRLSYIIMGMGAVISGIAVDYCIHVYVAMQAAQTRREAVKEVARPVIMGALTTAGVFGVFLFSRVPGYRQLALFTIVSILLSLGFALLLLPHFLTRKAALPEAEAKIFLRLWARVPDHAVIAVWALMMLACAAALPFVHFRTDVKQYDGSAKEIFRAEEEFEKTWGGKQKPAMLVVEAASFDEALETGTRIKPEVVSVLGAGNYAGLPQVWPPELVRLENLVRWNRYWKGERALKVRELFRAQAQVHGFSEDAFDSFFQMLYLGPEAVKAFEELSVMTQLKHRFAFPAETGYQLVSFFPDEETAVKALSQKSGQWPGVFVVSAKRFTALLSEAILSEAVYLAAAIAVIIPVLTFLFLRNIRLVLMALAPAATSVLVILGAVPALGLPLNAASVIALLIVGGLCIDYGIFMVHQSRCPLKTNTRAAVTLSALTTLFGAGALMMAKHPVLFSYGAAMVLGVSAGYLSSIFVVPALYRLGTREKTGVKLCQPV